MGSGSGSGEGSGAGIGQGTGEGSGLGSGTGSGGTSEGRIGILIGVVVLGVLVVAVGLIAGSFKGLHYYEFGFKRSMSSGAVNTDKTYGGGLHAIGPNNDFKVFQADAHFVSLPEISVGTRSGNDIDITVYFQYIIKEDELQLLHDAYDLGYDDIIEASAREAIKQTTVQFENIEFLRRRDMIENSLLSAVKNRIHSRCCPKHCNGPTDSNDDIFCELGCIPFDECTSEMMRLHVFVYGLQLGEVQLPSDLRERFLNALLLQAQIETKELIKNETIIVKETEVLVDVINNRATEISVNATAEAGLIRARADADAKAIVEEAKLNGVTSVFRVLNITDPNSMAAINYLRNLQKISNSYFSVDYQYLVSSSP